MGWGRADRSEGHGVGPRGAEGFLPGPFLGRLEQHPARLPFAQQLWGSTGPSVPVLWNLGSEAASMGKDTCPLSVLVSHPAPPGGGSWSLWHLGMELERCPVLGEEVLWRVCTLTQPLDPLRTVVAPPRAFFRHGSPSFPLRTCSSRLLGLPMPLPAG